MTKKITTEDFIKKSTKKHGDLYDYSKFRYTANKLRAIRFSGWTVCFPISLLPKLIQEFNNKAI